MEEINIEEIKQKTTTNVVFLSLRNIGLQAISTIGFFLLTILLGTGEVGLFAIVAESVGILGYFSDIGLASALIQQKNDVTKEDLQTTFLIQQILVIVSLIVISLIFFRLSASRSYGLKETWIFVSLCFAFFTASLKTIPSVLLERKLNFKLISTVDIAENISFYLVAVVFAFFHFGAYSYAIATFFRSILGLVLIYHFSSWPIGYSFSKTAAKRLFKYGIPFQLNSFIAMAKDRLSNLLVAGIIGRDSFGILSWAQKGPRIPLSFMDAIMRVTFPTFSRLQDKTDLLKRSLEKSLYFIALFVFPALAGISLIAPDIIKIIPKYTKWSPAIFPLYLYAVSYAIAAVTSPITNAFNAIGKITTTTKLMIMWTILTWIFYPLLSLRYGYIGTSYAAVIVGSSSFVVWIIAHNIFKINILKIILHPFISTILVIVSLISLQQLPLAPLSLLISKIIIGTLVYLCYHLTVSRNEVNWFISQTKWFSNKK
ncbi:MAG: oligosaccharide flippase family protein [Candidatus Shapirobacteria bacterium]|jgi:O-antigen/teichoic acid export membrane protein